MSAYAAEQLLAVSSGDMGSGETLMFWVLAPIAVLAALGMLLSKKAVHSALLLAATMICLALFYIAQGAPFLGVVQIVVYTGAVMMVFLFVLMLVGVDSSDSLVETLRGQRWAALAAVAGFLLLLLGGLGRLTRDDSVGLVEANAEGNVEGLAALLFGRYVLAFEMTGALLITAAVGAMVLTHRERLSPRRTQRQLSEERFRGDNPVMLPPPGVFARHNAVDTPALLPDGTPAENSVPRSLVARGDVHSPAPIADDVAQIERGPQS
jgi:NADH-quinone oxidoreductase subunit J